MNLNLSEKVVLVSGSSRGLGRAIAQSLLSEGALVILTGRNKSSLAQAEKELTQRSSKGAVMSFSGDLTRPSVIRQCLNKIKTRYGRLDILVANIGSGKGELGWQASDSAWDDLLDTNLLAPMRLIRTSVPLLKESEGASIILVSSITGFESVGGPYAYGASKAGLLLAAKQLSRELAPWKIRVNSIAPGNILFPGGTWDDKMKKNRSKVMTYIRESVPMGRFAGPDEIADVVAFISSPRAGFMTGSCVVVDGGQTHSY